MIILGIDPGTTSAGYAIIDDSNKSPRVLTAGVFLVKSVATEDRLMELHQQTKDLIKKWKPSVLAIERLFFTKNQKTALQVAEARGVVMLTTTLAGLRVYEYTPLEVKKTLTGDGRADKIQIKKMLGLIIPSLVELKAKDDVFDAISLALTFCYKEKALAVFK